MPKKFYPPWACRCTHWGHSTPWLRLRNNTKPFIGKLDKNSYSCTAQITLSIRLTL